MSPAARLTGALRALTEALGEHGRPFMIIGGVAAIAHGVPRITRDVDVTVAGPGTDLGVLLETLRRHGLEPRLADAAEFARAHQVLLVRHVASGVDVDLTLAWLPFEEEALAAAEIAVVEGIRLRLVRSEDLVVYKVVAWRPQDQQDIERLLTAHGRSMDLGRLRRLAAEISLAIEQPERPAELERLITRALGG